MAALTSIASLVGAGAGLYAQQQQIRQGNLAQRQQVDLAQRQEAQRQEQLALAQRAERRARQEQIARTVASARARLAAGGLSPDDGSAAALTAGLKEDAAAIQAESDAMFRARLASGRSSLLNQDGSLVPLIRAIPTFGNALRSLLD